MSKDIRIQTNGTSNDYDGINKINTTEVPYGSVGWVPIDNLSLTDIEVHCSGHYSAASDGVYGYYTVTVDVDLDTDSITGTDPVTGDVYTITLDDGGNIVRTRAGG